jgi:PBSX family phage portal protein
MRENYQVATKTRRVVRKRGAPAPIVKAEILGSGERRTTELLDFLASKEGNLPGGALAPPYDFKKLYTLYEQSTILRPNIDAYVTNIDSFGHHLVPSIDLAGKGAPERVSDAMLYEDALDAHDRGGASASGMPPDPKEVGAKIEELRRVARIEYSRLKAFFSYVCPTFSFIELRRRTRQDYEVLGNAFWEIVRNALGEVSRIYYANPMNMRLLKEDEEPIVVEEKAKVTDITWRSYKVRKHFRRYVKLAPRGKTVYFKQFGDPRVVSQKSGKYYESIEDLEAKEPGVAPATEIAHFAIFTPDTPYGVPRWISNLPGVMGSRELDEVNLNYFKNNVVPPLALLVSGGRLGKGVATKIEEFIEEHLKGKKSVHRILVLEAESQKGAGDVGPRTVPKVMFVPLRDAQLQDALFQNYDVRNEEKVARAFRLPRILRGDDKQMNRATAYAALKFAEEQVFEPEREHFDSFINRELFPELDITFWIFRSNSPIVRDPEAMAEMVVNLVKAGVLMISEARELCADIFNRTFEDLAEEWTNKPLPYILAQLHTATSPDQLGIGTSPVPVKPEESVPPEADMNRGPAPAPLQIRRAGTPLQAIGGGLTEEDAQ